MAKISKETKEMNERWVKKQDEIKKSWNGFYIGGFILSVLILVFLVYLYVR